MPMPTSAVRSRDLARASTEARRLVAESHGTNLDPIYEALDHRLLTRAGVVRPGVIARLVPAPLGWVDLDGFGTVTGPQLAARILCEADPAIQRAVAAVPADDLDRLIAVIATGLFRRVDDEVLAVASALAALIATGGLDPFCQRMGWRRRTERLAS